jgi:hypothetical protein
MRLQTRLGKPGLFQQVPRSAESWRPEPLGRLVRLVFTAAQRPAEMPCAPPRPYAWIIRTAAPFHAPLLQLYATSLYAAGVRSIPHQAIHENRSSPCFVRRTQTDNVAYLMGRISSVLGSLLGELLEAC